MFAGVDVGATLTKVYWQSLGRPRYASTANHSFDFILEALQAQGITKLHMTGVGRAKDVPGFVTKRMPGDPLLNEVVLQAQGARLLIPQDPAGSNQFLLASVGTGTSYALVLPKGMGPPLMGNPLGGGTILGVAWIMGVRDPKDIDALAAAGQPQDIRMKDRLLELYGDIRDEFILSYFGGFVGKEVSKEDVLATVVNLVAVSLIRESIVVAEKGFGDACQTLVCIGSTVNQFSTLRRYLEMYGLMLGKQVVFPDKGEYAAAIGAYLSEDME